jgi:hypothetical protein
MLGSATSKMRYMIGSLLALLGAAAAVYSPFRPWNAGTHGHDYGFTTLFDGFTGSKAALMASLFTPLLVAAILAVLGVLAQSRVLVFLGGLIALATVVLWLIQQSRTPGGLSSSSLGSGIALSLGGAAAMLVGAAVLERRHQDTRALAPGEVRGRGRHRRGSEFGHRRAGVSGEEGAAAAGGAALGAGAAGAAHRKPSSEPTESGSGSATSASGQGVTESERETPASGASTHPVGEPEPTEEPLPGNVRRLPSRGSGSRPSPDEEQTADGSPPRRGRDDKAA